MARFKNTIVECDVCGFEYRRSVMRSNSYGLMVCPKDFDGAYDTKNHPQNKSPVLKEKYFLENARPENNNDRNQVWNDAELTWENINKYWNLI